LAWLTRPSMQLATGRAHRWREDFQEFYDRDSVEATGYLRRWCYGAKRSRLQPIKDFVRLVETHWNGRLARQPHQQRTARAHEFAHPGGEGPGTGLPQQDQNDHHHLPHRGKTAQPVTLRSPPDLAKSPEFPTGSPGGAHRNPAHIRQI